MKNIQFRLIVMNFLQYAVWGAYLTSMGRYLAMHGMGTHIGIFYSIQGIISLFMPAIMGIVADRWIPAHKLLGLSHCLSGVFMLVAGLYGWQAGNGVQFAPLFSFYTLAVTFYMPTIALSNSVAFNALVKANLDTVKDFPPIRVFGTVGFIVTMWCVDLLGFQQTSSQFVFSGVLGICLAIYSLTLPACEIKPRTQQTSLSEALGLQAFALFKEKKMALFFIFSMCLGVSLQITNGFANPFLGSFEHFAEWSESFGVKHSNILISISQICEACCVLLIPYFLKRFGIKNVMLIAMFAWVMRFAFFGLGNPGSGVWLFVLSCVVYGFAFDFFNISGALFVDQETKPELRSSAQGVFMMMTNGVGATIGTLSAQQIVNRCVPTVTPETWEALKTDAAATLQQATEVWTGWQHAWFIFAGYSLVVALLFWAFFPNTSKVSSSTSAKK